MLGLNQLSLTGRKGGGSGGFYLGPELITNGDFSAGSTGWSPEAGWSFTGGAASITAADLSSLTSSFSTTGGKWYEVSFTISGYSSGLLRILTGAATNPNFGANGTYTAKVYTQFGYPVSFLAFGSFTGTLDNVSVKEILGDTSGLVSDY